MNNIYHIVAHRNQKEIDALKTKYDDFDTTSIPSIFHKALQLTATSWRPTTSWSDAHAVYFVNVREQEKPLVLRCNLGKGTPEIALQMEALVTNQVEKIGVPTNHILHVDISRKDFPFDFQIQETLEGKNLEDEFTGTKEQYNALSFQLGQCIARLSTLTYQRFGLFDEKYISQNELRGTTGTFYDYLITALEEDIGYLTSNNLITSMTANAIIKQFERDKSLTALKKGSLVHHDLSDHNIIYNKDKIIGIFDWEAACIGDSVLDLASCPTWKTHFPREKKLLEGYGSLIPLPEHFQEKRDLYLLRTILWKSALHFKRKKPWAAEKQQRLQKALRPYKLHTIA